MPYKLPYLFGGGFTDDFEGATGEHLTCLLDAMNSLENSFLLLAIAQEQMDTVEDLEELRCRIALLLDCLQTRMEPDVQLMRDSLDLLQQWYSPVSPLP